MNAPTPAPWSFSVEPNHREGSDFYSIWAPDFVWPDGRRGRFIAWLGGGMGEAGTSERLKRETGAARRDEEIEADARLIAAAPDLLEALRKFVAEAEDYHSSSCRPDGSCCDGICAAIPAGRAAIAKADGR